MARPWLLDVNIPKAVASVLAEVGIEAHHATSRGWGDLKNGALVETASLHGFGCVLTRDKLFGESAARALKHFPEFSVVLVTISQARGPEFLQLFRQAWEKDPINPVPGRLCNWPE